MKNELLGLCVMLTIQNAFAQSPTGIQPYQEYRKRIESAQRLSPLDNGLFGEDVSLYNGSTYFAVADIDVPGNSSLPVQLVRRLAIDLQPQGNFPYNALLGGLGNWDVDVPYMAATYATGNSNWEWKSTRCSVGSVPPLSMGANGAFHITEAWQGISVHVPGSGDRNALGLTSQVPRPTDGTTYRLTTAERDVFDCIPIQSGLPGEGFRMTTTAGLRYYFDVATIRSAATLEKAIQPDMGNPNVWSQVYLYRNRIYLLASKIEDRNGNTVQFQYDGNGHPVRIWSNDGRDIALTYTGGRLASATSHGRSWQYQYDSAGNLTYVIMPDASRWQYAYSDTLMPSAPLVPELPEPQYCQGASPGLSAGITITATHPSGAVGTFIFENRRHFRSGVHATECLVVGEGTETPSFTLLVPFYFDVMSLTSKTISGPGLQTRTWNYDYWGYDTAALIPPLWGSRTSSPSYPCTTCTQFKAVTVTNPDSTKLRYRFGILYMANDGRQLQMETLRADGSVIRAEVNEYMSEADALNQAFYGQYGTILGNVSDPASAKVRPMVKKIVTQDGRSFKWEVDEACAVGSVTTYCFDTHARPTKVTKSSAPSP